MARMAKLGLTPRYWRWLWLFNVLKWVPFVPLLVFWCIATPLSLLQNWGADRLNSLYVKAYNADLRRKRNREGGK